MTVLIQLTTAGYDTGPFNLYSDVDSFGVPFEVGVSKVDLLAGYLSSLVPDLTTTIRVCSTALYCANCVDIEVAPYCEGCTCYTITSTPGTQVNYLDCYGDEQSFEYVDVTQICAEKYIVPHPKGELSLNALDVFDTSKPLRVRGKGYNGGDFYINLHVNFKRN